MALFTNLRLYRLHSAWPASEQELSERLEAQVFTPCGAFTERSSGWETPAAGGAGLLCHRVTGVDMLRLRSQVRLLPAAAVKEALEDKVSQFFNRTGRKPSRKEKRDLKDDLYHELLPQTLVKSDRINGFYMDREGLIGVDTASDKDAERFLDLLREALGSLVVVPLSFNKPLGEYLTGLYLGATSGQLLVGRECRMQDPMNARTSVQWSEFDIVDADVRKHVNSGLRLERVGLEFDETLRCVMDRDGVMRKIKLLGMDDDPELDAPVFDQGAIVVGEQAEASGSPKDFNDPAAESRAELMRLETELVLFTGTLRRMLTLLQKELDGFSSLDPQHDPQHDSHQDGEATADVA